MSLANWLYNNRKDLAKQHTLVTKPTDKVIKIIDTRQYPK